jgi:hypothetical protein
MSSVCPACRCVLTCTVRKRPRLSRARSKDPSVKSAFQEVARGWLVLAEQMEWMDSQKVPPNKKLRREPPGWPPGVVPPGQNDN